MTPALIELHDVYKIYNPGENEVQAAYAVSMTVHKGEFTALAGPSGSGKTTLLNLIGCLDRPTSGDIKINGESVIGLSNSGQARIRNEKIGFIFQQFNLIPILTAYENVELAVQINRNIPKPDRRQKIEELLELVGLSTMIHRKPTELSGGQQQRVAIARALVKQPELVLADEPTANLDSLTAQEILDLMKTLNQELQTTFLFSTHDKLVMDFAQRLESGFGTGEYKALKRRMRTVYLLKLALKNTLRNKKRSLITATSLLIGVAMIIFAHGFLDGLDNSVIDGQIRYDSGHLRIASQGFFTDEEDLIYEKFLEHPQTLKNEFSKVSMSVTPYERILFKAELSDGNHSLLARGLGVVVPEYFPAFQYTIRGELPPERYQGLSPIWLGYDLGQAFNTAVGEILTILTRTRYGSYTADDYIIAGFISCSNPIIDNFSFFLNLDDAQNLLDAPDACSDFVCFCSSREASTVVKEKIGRAVPGLELQTWQEKAEILLSINRFRRKVFSIINGIILAIVATSIANTVLMSCFERIREIGTLKALGYQQHSILILFLVEACFIGLIGASAGIVLGGSITTYFEIYGIDFGKVTQSGGQAVSVSMAAIIYTVFNKSHALFAFTIGMVITTLSALFPAVRFSKLNPVHALQR